MPAWTAPDMIDGLETLFNADGTLSALDPGLDVFTYDPSPDEIDTDVMLVGFEASDSQDYAALGQSRTKQDVTLKCLIIIWRPSGVSTAAKTARDRAEAILDRVEVIVRDTPPSVGDQTISAIVTNRAMQQFPSEVGSEGVPVRVCKIEFDIRYESRTSA